MIQTGGMDAEMNEKRGNDSIQNEANNGLPNLLGTIAMARTGVVDSATSQFFISLGDNSRLDFTSETSSGYGYTAFGSVTEGMDVVDIIAQVPTGSQRGYTDVPMEAVVLTSVTLEE
jgi:peptidyl-prolyl cis-trans isomerase B (cyclophilin B)